MSYVAIDRLLAIPASTDKDCRIEQDPTYGHIRLWIKGHNVLYLDINTKKIQLLGENDPDSGVTRNAQGYVVVTQGTTDLNP